MFEHEDLHTVIAFCLPFKDDSLVAQISSFQLETSSHFSGGESLLLVDY